MKSSVVTLLFLTIIGAACKSRSFHDSAPVLNNGALVTPTSEVASSFLTLAQARSYGPGNRCPIGSIKTVSGLIAKDCLIVTFCGGALITVPGVPEPLILTARHCAKTFEQFAVEDNFFVINEHEPDRIIPVKPYIIPLAATDSGHVEAEPQSEIKKLDRGGDLAIVRLDLTSESAMAALAQMKPARLAPQNYSTLSHEHQLAFARFDEEDPLSPVPIESFANAPLVISTGKGNQSFERLARVVLTENDEKLHAVPMAMAGSIPEFSTGLLLAPKARPDNRTGQGDSGSPVFVSPQLAPFNSSSDLSQMDVNAVRDLRVAGVVSGGPSFVGQWALITLVRPDTEAAIRATMNIP